jgi:hypothetical protein
MKKMKKLILLILLPIPSIFAQHSLQLKVGTIIEGKLIEVKKDTIVFMFQGNNLRLPVSKVKSINLDGQRIVNTSENFTLSGVVTFFFNKYQDNKPDLGAEVFIADSVFVSDIDIEAIKLYKKASFMRNIYKDYKASGLNVPDNVINDLRSYGAETEGEFKTIDKKATANVLKVQYAVNAVKLFIDGNGTFSTNLPKGTYYVLIRSKNRTDLSVTELLGKVYFEKIKITNQNKTINTKFDLH